MISKEDVNQLEPFQARSIIEQLRKGSVPIEYVPFFTVGRKNWLTYIEEDLEHYIGQGGSKVRFISGDYGDGKTHFMSVIRHLAMEKGFAVSFVVLTREVPIHKFETVYQTIVRQLQGDFQGIGIRNLLEAWLEKLGLTPIQAQKNKTQKDEAQKKRIALTDEFRNIPGMDINFANALIALVNNHFTPFPPDEEEKRDADREVLLHWFEGGKVTKRELKPFQIYEFLNKANSKQFMNSLILFLRHMGQQGLILLLDEMETVMAQSASIRNAAYENVRLLIDNSESSQYLHIFFSIIPDVLIMEKGFKSYDALWSRIRSIGESGKLNYRGVLVDIHQTPLKTKELVELGRCLRTIHGISYRWEPMDLVTDELIEEICTNQKQMGVISEVRLFIKQLINILDMAEQGESPEDMDMGKQIVETIREMETEKMEQLQPSWDS
ncbi:MAG: ATP-binding protein [Desulfobacula sp.]|uniref:BREX system ATP-binding domain-containing protein n=1 Tax=Desulfobacula sp. TaxID=2593537 RepID=UPI0025BD49D9|nr:BREX system ATP-binding domain-containing protein [Desulfobacula sp.]MCD4719483.1 ATP-binding protein [Desulfobacula sp.]